ncbi:MAG TPA: HAMP domain-containing protein, partial [Kofleriaceae bacterium]|nr:HAMP domain-containing protein [Kofleriaceae bacterium]
MNSGSNHPTRSVGAKLIAAFVVLLGLGGVFGAVALSRLSAVRGEVDDVTQGSLPNLVAATTLGADIAEIQRQLLRQMLATTADDRIAAERTIAASVSRISRELAELAGTAPQADLRELLPEAQRTWSAYLGVQEAAMTTAHDPDHAAARVALRGRTMAIGAQLRDLVSEIVVRIEHEGAASNLDIYRAVGSFRLWIVAIALVSLAIATAIGLLLTRRLTRPIRALEAAASAMARGELGGEVAYTAEDELGALAASFRASSGALGSVVGELQRLIHAAQDGRLGVRGDATRFAGAYAELVSGTNALL